MELRSLCDFKLLVQICLICFISFDFVLSYGARRRVYTRQQLRNDISCPQARGQFAHPRHCDRYLNCWDGEFIVEKCPGSLLFNDKIRACDWSKNVDCSNKEDAPPPPIASHPINSEPITPPSKPVWKPKPKPPFGQAKPEQEEPTTFRPGPTVSFKPKPQHRPENNEPENTAATTVATLNPGGSKPTFKPTDQDSGFFPSFPSWPTLKCPISQGILPVKDRCDTVVVCLSGVGHLLRCPHGHNFDPALGTCSSNRVGDDCKTDPTWHRELLKNKINLLSSPAVKFVYVPQAVFTPI